MAITTDPQDPRLGQTDPQTGLSAAYVVLDEEQRRKDYARPLRRSYVHWYMKDGSDVPAVVLNEHLPLLGGCGALTTMATAIAETFAIEPGYYALTYCTKCRTHLPVEEFHWDGSMAKVGS